MKIKTFLLLLPILFLPMRSGAEILKKICASDCAGPMASVTSWRDAKGVAMIFEFRGDLRACSHPPLVFFDTEPKAVLTIPEVALNPQDALQSEQFKALHQKREALLKGLTQGKPYPCPLK